MDKIFSTRDIYLAATLITLKFFLNRIDYSIEGSKNQPIGYFLFDNTQELQDAKSRYSQGLLAVEPKAFVTNMKSLKSEVSNIYSNPHMKN